MQAAVALLGPLHRLEDILCLVELAFSDRLVYPDDILPYNQLSITGACLLCRVKLNRISEPANMSSGDENEHSTAVELEHSASAQPQVKKRRIQTVRRAYAVSPTWDRP